MYAWNGYFNQKVYNKWSHFLTVTVQVTQVHTCIELADHVQHVEELVNGLFAFIVDAP
jgi:hypothetical protein